MCFRFFVFNIQNVMMWPFHAVIFHKLMGEYAEIVLCCGLYDGGLWQERETLKTEQQSFKSCRSYFLRSTATFQKKQKTCIFLTLNVAFLCLWNILLHKQVLSTILLWFLTKKISPQGPFLSCSASCD